MLGGASMKDGLPRTGPFQLLLGPTTYGVLDAACPMSGKPSCYFIGKIAALDIAFIYRTSIVRAIDAYSCGRSVAVSPS